MTGAVKPGVYQLSLNFEVPEGTTGQDLGDKFALTARTALNDLFPQILPGQESLTRRADYSGIHTMFSYQCRHHQ